MATKKTKSSSKKSKNGGFLGRITDLLNQIELEGADDPLGQDSSGGKSSPGAYQDSVDRPPDQVRKGVEGVASHPTNYSEFTSRGNPIHTADPFHADYDKGYEADYAIAANYTLLNGRHNGLLSFDGSGYGIPLFVQDLNIDFAMSGDTHQSQKGAVFYPKNFQQTSLTLSCQAPNPLYYGKVMEAIRDSQMPFAKVSRLEVWQPSDRDATIHNKYEPIDCDGYVTLAQRRHERHVYSPAFEITFTVVVFRSPTDWASDLNSYQMKSDWHLMVTPDPKNGREFVFEEAPELYKTAEEQRAAANKISNDVNKTKQKRDLDAAAQAAALANKKKNR